MKAIFDFANYKEFVRARLEEFPNSGRGQFQRMAQAAGMQPSNISQVFNGPKDLTLEQSEALTRYFQMTEIESDFFLLLVSYARAGSSQLRFKLKRQIAKFQNNAKQLAVRLPADHVMTTAEKAVFYSSWDYSAIHILSFIPGMRTVEAVSKHLRLPRPRVQEIVNFLIEQGLCVSTPQGFIPGTKHTHLPANSPLTVRQHANWRIRAIDGHLRMNQENELAYSGQVSISRDDALRIRTLCVSLLEDIRKTVDPSPCEVAYCINLDWLEI
jgi:uncharacterized protein (TIGR02147 family)